MAACKTLTALARQCGKNAKAGINPDVYAIAFDDLVALDGTTEVYTESVTGLVDEIGVGVPKFVKIGTVLNQGAIKEDYTLADNGTFDIVKELSILVTNVGSVDTKKGVEQLMGQPIAVLVKMQTGAWIAFGLNGQFQLKGSAGAVDSSSNGRTLTLSGSDAVLIQVVDPTIIPDVITA